MKNMIKKFKGLNKKIKIIILISALCVVTLSVGSIYVLSNVEENDKVAEKDNSSTKDDKISSEDKKKEKSKEDKKAIDEEQKEEKDDVKSDIKTSLNTPKENVDSGSSGNSGGSTTTVTPTSPSKVCGAPGVYFDDLPCDTILTQYNMNGWGVGNSGMLFNSSSEAWDYGNAKIDEWQNVWLNDTTGTVPYPQYTGFDGYTVQFNDGSQKWSVMFK